jgi:DNA-binding response OmpR family regulator
LGLVLYSPLWGLKMSQGQQKWARQHEGSERILVVDDDPGIREVLEEALSRLGYQVQGASDGLWVSRVLREGVFPFELVILDWRLPDLDGLAVLRELQTFAQATPVILISIAADDQLRAEALSLGAFEVLRKPIDFGALCSVVEGALQRHRGS